MQQAVKIKGAQMKDMRKKFDEYPTFYQNSMFHKDDVTCVRFEPHPWHDDAHVGKEQNTHAFIQRAGIPRTDRHDPNTVPTTPACRTLPFADRMDGAMKLKDKGNAFFKEGKLVDAQFKYEEAAGIFRYCLNKGGGRQESLSPLAPHSHHHTRCSTFLPTFDSACAAAPPFPSPPHTSLLHARWS